MKSSMIPEGRIHSSSTSLGIHKLMCSLVFLGSKKYPYKGVLDQLANRAGSNGTNAWTANDRESSEQFELKSDTAYTIATAGTEGFLKMLPSWLTSFLCYCC